LKKNKSVIVLDTSALLAYIEDEQGAEYVDTVLAEAEHDDILVYLSFVTLTEVFYITMQEKDESTAQTRIDLIKSLPCIIEESSESLNLAAAKLKAKNRISLADAYIAALCQERQGVLVHKDPEFEQLPPAIKQHKLPYKS
jgi:predicted nucleic acid-binding protein